jgi:uncharacterized phiE125 gp8 family phage protein
MHLRLDETTDQDLVQQYINAAIAYGESATESSFAPREITATYFTTPSDGKLYLPRGPVISITTITANGITPATWAYQRMGNSDYIYSISSLVTPVVVVYQAGYATLPADLQQAILMTVGQFYENRETQTNQNMITVSQGAENIFNRYKRTSLLG